MTVESASYVNDLNTSYPASGDDRSEGDDHLRLLKTVLKSTFPYLGGVLFKMTGGLSGSQTPTYNTSNTNIYAFTGNGTLNLPAVATAGNGWMCGVYAPSGVTVTVDPNSSETINGSGTLTVTAGFALIFNSGAAWFALVTDAGTDPRLIGEIVPYAGTTLPAGWLWCDGSVISRSTYASLFAAFGSADVYGGGDGSTTFGLPDLRGRLPLGKDNMDNSVGTGGGTAGRVTSGVSGVNGATLGATGGAQAVTLTTNEMPSHNHGGTAALSGSTASGGAHTHDIATTAALGSTAPEVQHLLADGTSNTEATASGGAHTHTLSGSATISSQGGGAAHNNMPPVQVVNYIIKAA